MDQHNELVLGPFAALRVCGTRETTRKLLPLYVAFAGKNLEQNPRPPKVDPTVAAVAWASWAEQRRHCTGSFTGLIHGFDGEHGR